MTASSPLSLKQEKNPRLAADVGFDNAAEKLN